MNNSIYIGKKLYLILCIALIICTFSVDYVICLNKDIDFVDEALTYESSNSVWKESFFNKDNEWISGSDISNYLSATEWNPKLITITRKLWTDHVPFYFWVFRIVSIIFHGTPSPWIGMGINIFFEILFLIWLLKVSYVNFKREMSDSIMVFISASLFLLIFSLSLNQVTLIRMYLMLTLEMIMFIWYITKISWFCEDGKILLKNERIMYFVVVAAGMLTHYLFWPFFCIYTVILMMLMFIRKNKKGLISVIKISVADFVFVTIIDPYWIYRLIKYNLPHSSGDGHFIDSLLLAIKDSFNILFSYLYMNTMNHYFEILISIGLILIFTFITIREKRYKLLYALGGIMLSDYLYMVIIQIVYHDVDRYCYAAISIWVIIQCIMVSYVFTRIFVKRNLENIIIFVLSLLLISIIVFSNVSTVRHNLVFMGNKDTYNELKTNYSDVPWIVYVPEQSWREWCSVYKFMIPDKIAFVYGNTEYENKLVLDANQKLLLWVTTEEDDSLKKGIEYISSLTDKEFTVSEESIGIRCLNGYIIEIN